ncbi:UNKNOWN [Stylonychia lemnae]|uniref:Transmembrane protein n=1 Tax=Stylonychia lemnae TaxID=5949 RepID=A0A078ATM3_STYLE|nr:UNKNOWN [Stylonychia lemnae]|eukprot:CDW85589.1 UNKNOWN [Stylonychia lemnae]
MSYNQQPTTPKDQNNIAKQDSNNSQISPQQQRFNPGINHSVTLGSIANPQGQILTMDEFLQKIDPNEIEIKVVRFDKKYFGQSTYVIEIFLVELEVCYESNKAITEFQAFYEALNMKFRNLKLSEFPTSSTFKMNSSNEKRIQKFQELFDLILRYACRYQEMAQPLMIMLYKFLLSRAKIIQKKPAQQLDASTKSNHQRQHSQTISLQNEQQIDTKQESLTSQQLNKISEGQDSSQNQYQSLGGDLSQSNQHFKLVQNRNRAESMKLYEPANLLEFDSKDHDDLNMIFETNSDKQNDDIANSKGSLSVRSKGSKRRRRSQEPQLDKIIDHNLSPDIHAVKRQNNSAKRGNKQHLRSRINSNQEEETKFESVTSQENQKQKDELSEKKYKSGQVQLYEKAPDEDVSPDKKQSILITPKANQEHSIISKFQEQSQSVANQQLQNRKADERAKQAKFEQKLKEIRVHRESQISLENFDYLFAKLPHKNDWKKYYVRYNNSQLMFCNSVKRHDFKCSFVLYKAVVRRQRIYIGGVDDDSQPRKIDALMISHKYDDDAMYITIPEIYESPEFQKIFLPLLDVIEQNLNKNAANIPDNMVPIDQTNKNPFGKIMMEIQSIKHFPYYHNIFVRVTCNPFVLHSRKILDNQLEFQQRYYIPVHNHFNTLKIEIINILNDGWFREHVKEQVIATYEIRLTDIDKEPFDEVGLIKLPISETVDFKKLGLRPVQDMENQVKKKQAYLQLRVQDMTRIDSMIVFNPNRDIVEDRRKKSGYGFKEISTVMTRTKLIIFLFEYLRDIDRPVLYFDYPRFSILWFVSLEIFTITFNPFYLLTYLTIFVFVLVGSYSEFWVTYITPHISEIFFKEEHLNKLIIPNHQVRTHDQISQEKSMQSLREASNELKQMHQDYNIKDKNILGKFRDFKKSSTVTLNYMDITCDFFEKTKNLIKWEEPRMTKYFLLLCIVLFIAVTFIPIRIIISVYLVYKFYRGQFYHQRRIRSNREIISIEFLNFLEESKLKSNFLNNYDEQWEKVLGKSMNIKLFEQKLSFYFQETLKLYFPKDILKLKDNNNANYIADTPNKLIDYVSKVKDKLQLPLRDRNEQHLEFNSNLYRSAIPSYIYLLNFLMNRVPSDIYRIKNPKLEIGQENKGADGKEKVFTVKQEVREDLKGVIENDSQNNATGERQGIANQILSGIQQQIEESLNVKKQK